MRPFLVRNRSKFRYLISVPVCIILILNIQLITQIKEINKFYSPNNQDNNAFVSSTNFIKNTTEIPQKVNITINKNVNHEIDALRQKINALNSYPKINNKHLIDDLLKNKPNIKSSTLSNTSTISLPVATKVYTMPKFFVIVIQVHSRLNYLRELIKSLKEVKYIEQALVIFSHDIYDEEMNQLVKSIDFCATLQIFYPFSLQLYPNTFPGNDPNDCPKSINKAKALEIKCNNAAYSDKYGNYRESHVVQIKHHWFWKLSFIFEKLNETRLLENLHVLILEEDYYLLPDSIHALRKLSEIILSDIDVVSLAIFERNKQNLEMKNLNKFGKAYWHTTSHNTGLMLSRTQWKMIKDCSNAFCTYDDYNWDWTLQHLSQTCFKLPLVAIFPVSSRVIHIGECGTHHKGSNCDPKEKIESLKKTIQNKQTQFFPKKFELNGVNTGIIAIKKSNGGWGDPRDHNLCKSFIDQYIKSNNTKAIKI
ncbi:unnamed protein product [Brachionus calyciflorus]|uniref:Alpha-1,6-mannosyl-glycoprotein 2-beta-N-acetylglucosaminyltransferase n=1 Tax=Brachionus calyciflorus TaxID=104777 RepID=A0A813M305_9BILA|nr:unnamed protein product [Brachionus calyciflorus]